MWIRGPIGPNRSGLAAVCFHHQKTATWTAPCCFESLGCSMPLDGHVQGSLESLVVNLLDAVLQQSAMSAQLPNRCRGGSVKLQRAKALIAEQAENPALSPHVFGRSIGVSRRRLYQLFSEIAEISMGCT